MRTEVIMERKFINGAVIKQNHKTGYFNVSGFIGKHNDIRKAEGKSVKNLSKFLHDKGFKEFLTELSLAEGVPESELVIIKRGKVNGGTWLHPVAFIKVALWIDVKLEVKVMKWLFDNLLKNRDDSGTSFKEYNKALDKAFKMTPTLYPKIANRIANSCGVCGKDKWNKASDHQLELRNKIQENIVILADVSPDIMTCVNTAVKKAKDYLEEEF